MAKKKDEKEEETVVLGTFECKAVNEGGVEARLSDEKGQSTLVNRMKAANKGLEVGAVYELRAVKVEDVPGQTFVTAQVPSEDVGSLPASAEIVEE